MRSFFYPAWGLAGVLTLAGAAWASSPDRDWADHMDSAVRAYQGKDYATAERELQTAVSLAEKFKGKSKETRLSDSLSMLGEVYRAQKKFAEGEPVFQRALTHLEAVLGPEDKETVRLMVNFGTFYFTNDKWKEAEALYQKALAIQEKDLKGKPDDAATAQTVKNLGSLTYTQGKYAEAEQLYRRALEGQERNLGKEDPKVALTLQSLGWAYWRLKRNPEAEPLFQRAIAIYEKRFGPDHPGTAAGLDDYALFLEKCGRKDEAQPFRARAKAIRDKSGH